MRRTTTHREVHHGYSGYEYVVEYRLGKTNIADYISRHPSTRTSSSNVQAIDEFAWSLVEAEMVVKIGGPEAVTKKEVKEETFKSPMLLKLQHAIR